VNCWSVTLFEFLKVFKLKCDLFFLQVFHLTKSRQLDSRRRLCML